MDIYFPQRRLTQILLAFWGILVVAGLIVELAKASTPDRSKGELSYFFGLSYEQNLPTWYSASLLLLCAVLLLLIAIANLRALLPFRWHWLALSLIFFYISLDEAVTLHESLSHFFDFGGVLYFGWVIPATAVVLGLGLVYLPFVLHLRQPARRRFIVAGLLYVGGALGVEFILGYWTDVAGDRNLVYGLIDLVEESAEILGTTLFLLALLRYLNHDRAMVSIRFGSNENS